tara:strand:- start:19 stop:423 length:405 start_codon:yes stop_codon:yes gene_type:complete
VLNKIWEVEKKFNEQDVISFSKLTGDNNRIHLDEEYAKKSFFGKRVVHGMLVASLFSRIFGKIFPGAGSIYLKQDIKFIAPVFIGDTIIARVKLKKLNSEKSDGTFHCWCVNQDGKKTILGSATVRFPDTQSLK